MLGLNPQDEIARQYDLVWHERWPRILLTTVGHLMGALFLPLWIPIATASANIFAEITSMRLMPGLDPRQHRKRYTLFLILTFVMELVFTTIPVLCWQTDLPYAHAFAVGMILATLLHLATVRSLHLPTGLIGIAGVALPTLIGNTYYWLQRDEMTGLLMSTIGIFTAMSYAAVAIQSNNRLQKENAEVRVAAQAAERTKSRFLAQMSHELRTPLNAILGMGHAEMRRNRDGVSQQRLSVLMASAEGLATILDDILDLSAIEEGRMPIRRVPVIPRQEILATLALFQPGADEAGLGLANDLDRSLIYPAMLDPQRLRQCLSNLLSNALKYTSEGEVRLTARLIMADDPEQDPTLEIDIADTGSGIPTHLLDLIFQPFAQSPDLPRPVQGGPATEKRKSNGLGLSISRALARQMGGDLVILESKVADSTNDNRTGTTFRLHLAMPTAPRDSVTIPPVAATATKPPAAGTSAAAGLSILVVDDIATNRLVASTYLRMLGANTIEAESGAEALERLAGGKIDLVLLDMNMPGMNGEETLRRIRALPGGEGTAVIAMTADALSEHRDRYLASGMDGYIAKPLHPSRMEVEIAAALNRHQSGATEAT
ncbi:MAG: response regulator [Pseudorhodobacter sp.]